MALQVWLPLNGNLENKGLFNTTVTNSGATVNASGKIGQCYQFQKSALNYISMSKTNIIDGDAPFSVCMWVKHNYTSVYDQLFEINGYATGLGIEIYSSNTLRIAIAGTDTTYSTGFTSETWQHVCVTFSGTEVKTYVNGILLGTVTFSGWSSSYSDMWIGSRGPGSSCGLNGYVNDFRVYDHCLSQKEIKEISKGLVLHYPLNDKYFGNINLFDTSYVPNKTVINGTVTISGNNITMTSTGADTYLNGIVYSTASTYNSTIGPQVYLNKANSMTVTVYDDIRIDSCYVSFFDSNNVASYYSGYKNYDYREIRSADNKVIFQFNDIPSSVAYATVRVGDPDSVSGNIYTFRLKVEIGKTSSEYSEYGDEEFNGTTIYDCSGYGNDGEIISSIAPTIVSDSPRYSHCLNIKDSRISINRDNLLSVFANNPFTISFWLNTENGCRIFEANESFSTGKCLHIQTQNNCLAFKFYSPDLYAGFTNYINQWIYVTCTYDLSTLKIYINGSYDTSMSGTLNIESLNMIQIGYAQNAQTTVDAYISDFRIYATALSADDIMDLYQTSASINKNGTLMCYEIEED